MNRKKLIQLVAHSSGMSEENTSEMLNTFIRTIKFALRTDHEISIRGFGKLYVAHEDERTARDIRKGVEIVIPSRNVVRFKPFDNLKEQIQEDYGNIGGFD